MPSCYSDLPAMASPLPIDPDTIAIASATSDVASSDLVVALTTVQAAAAASSERVATVEAASQQEHAAMAAAAATAPTDLAAALATLQARIAAAALELQLAAVLRATAPPPRPATVAATTLGQAAPAAGAFETSSVGYLHAQAIDIQDI
jgi:hypothetical protein